MEKSKIKVAVIEDDLATRQKWQKVINNMPDMECNLVFRDIEDATMGDNYVKYEDIDVLLMDIGLGKGKTTGIEGAKIFKKELPNLDIIMVTNYEDEDKLFDAFKNGAVGYLVKNYTSDSFLIEKIKEVVIEKGAVMSMQIARKVTNFFKEKDNVRTVGGKLYYFEYLNAQENRTLQLLATGLSNKEIGEQLNVTEVNVRNYVKAIYRKLEKKNKVKKVNRVKATLLWLGFKI